jgi:hypothetical protein
MAKLMKSKLWACKILPGALFYGEELWQMGLKSAPGHVKILLKLFFAPKNYGKSAEIPLWACKNSPKALFRAKKLWQISPKYCSGHVKRAATLIYKCDSSIILP